MSATTIRDRVLEILDQLPEDATIEDVMEQLYFVAKVERGLAQADAGETVPHEEARRRLVGE